MCDLGKRVTKASKRRERYAKRAPKDSSSGTDAATDLSSLIYVEEEETPYNASSSSDDTPWVWNVHAPPFVPQQYRSPVSTSSSSCMVPAVGDDVVNAGREILFDSPEFRLVKSEKDDLHIEVKGSGLGGIHLKQELSMVQRRACGFCGFADHDLRSEECRCCGLNLMSSWALANSSSDESGDDAEDGEDSSESATSGEKLSSALPTVMEEEENEEEKGGDVDGHDSESREGLEGDGVPTYYVTAEVVAELLGVRNAAWVNDGMMYEDEYARYIARGRDDPEVR